MAITATAIATSVSALCRAQEDPFLLLEATRRCIRGLLRRSADHPLTRCWIDYPCGEEEITLLEEELLPVLQHCLQRVAEIEADLQEEQEARMAIAQLRKELAAEAEAREAQLGF